LGWLPHDNCKDITVTLQVPKQNQEWQRRRDDEQVRKNLPPGDSFAICTSEFAHPAGLACSALALQGRRQRSAILFPDPANAGRRFIPVRSNEVGLYNDKMIRTCFGMC
jgi:hypothetical protein